MSVPLVSDKKYQYCCTGYWYLYGYLDNWY